MEFAAIISDLQKITALPITDSISESVYNLMIKFSLSHKLSLPDALIAATVLEIIMLLLALTPNP